VPQVRLYAVVRPTSRSIDLPARAGGERFHVLNLGFASAVYSDSVRALDPTLANLKRYDAIVKQLAAASEAILPARFGTVVETTEQLRSAIIEQQEKFEAALDLVAGCEQMTVRLFEGRGQREEGEGHGESGASYLRSRASIARIGPSRIIQTHSNVRALVRAERSETTGDRVTIYHLIEKGSAARYRTTLTQAAISEADVRITGPFPPYAFVPGIDRAPWTNYEQPKTSRRKTRPARSRADRRSTRNTR